MKQLLRMAASLGATALGGLLLIADGDLCSRYAAFRGSARYVADCGELASGQGTVSLDLPATASDAEAALWETARRQLDEGGLHASHVSINYDGSCTGDKDRAVASSLLLSFRSAQVVEHRCDKLDLPVTEESTVTCAPANAVDSSPCTITFWPAEQ